MDDAGAPVLRGPHRAAGERADPADALGRSRRALPTSKNHFAALAVELDLVDDLAGADLAQLRRPVGGQDDERDAALARLVDGGREVRRRGARRAGDDDRAPRRLRQAEREEPRAALVDVRPAADPAVAHEGQHDRRRARPRRRARVAPRRSERARRRARASGCAGRATAPAPRIHRHGPLMGPRPPPAGRATLPGRRRARPPRAERSRPQVDGAAPGASPTRCAGYSMGGRIALHLALAQPDLVQRLVLVSHHRRASRTRASASRRRAADERARRRDRARRGGGVRRAVGRRSRSSPASRPRSPRPRTPTACATRRRTLAATLRGARHRHDGAGLAPPRTS